MAGIDKRVGRVVVTLAAIGMATTLLWIGASAALAAPGGNEASAKQCADWASLYKEDGSSFVDRGDCVSYAAEGGTILTSPPPPDTLPFRVLVDAPSSAAGAYEAAGADFGITPGQSGSLVLVNDGTTLPTQGCSPLAGFPAGAIAIVDRGGCDDILKVDNAQAAGAVAVVVVNDAPGEPVTMTGSGFSITISAVLVSQSDGATIKAGLPADGTVTTAP